MIDNKGLIHEAYRKSCDLWIILHEFKKKTYTEQDMHCFL